MKIVATTRTRNEEDNIENFCMSHQFCDEILIVDGGSEDSTVQIAKKMPKTEVQFFRERIWSEGNRHWRNPHGKMINFITNYAFEVMQADWVIFDDCDSFPTLALQDIGREMFLRAESLFCKAIYLYHIYIYHYDKYFPEMNNAGTAIWAWRKGSGIYADEENPWSHLIIRPTDISHVSYGYPFSNLHYFMPTDEKIRQKLDFYRENGQHTHLPTFEEFNPIKMHGQLKPLEEWMLFKK